MTAGRKLPWAAGPAIDDPIAFQQTWLRRRLWSVQQEIGRAVEESSQIAVKGCHASGKTFLAAGIPLHWLIKYRQGKVFITAPTLRQVKTFWEEIALARRTSRVAQLLPEPSTTALKISEDRYAIGASSSKGVNLQGFHGRDVLIICDEAPGIQSDIWDAIEGIRAGGRVRVLKLGNPVVPSGAFYDSFGKARTIHRCISISAFDTPNFQRPAGGAITIDELLAMDDAELDYAPFPSLVTRRWVKERYIAWGPNHPKYRSRVLAEFPSESPYAVFPLSWIERAKREPTERELKEAAGRAIQVGIDVAGAGHDETALCARVNGIVLHQEAWPDPDPRGAVLKLLWALKTRRDYPLGIVVVDVIGIGYNFALHIADQGFQVYGFNAGARPIDPTQFVNQKAEAHFTAREYLRLDAISNLHDDECEAQLATIQYRETPRGLTEIESKEQRNKRGIPGSPDRAEAFVNAFARIVPQTIEIPIARGYQISPI